MDVKIYKITKIDDHSHLKAFVDLLFENELIVFGFKIVEGKNGLFLSNPDKKVSDVKYIDIARFVTFETKKEIEKKIIDTYLNQVGEEW